MLIAIQNIFYNRTAKKTLPEHILSIFEQYKKSYKCYGRSYISMPQSVISSSDNTFVSHLLELDSDMTSRMLEEGKSSYDIYQIYLERLSLHQKACLFPLSEPEKAILEAKKKDIYIEFKLFTLKQEVKKQLDQIKTTLYDIKNFES